LFVGIQIDDEYNVGKGRDWGFVSCNVKSLGERRLGFVLASVYLEGDGFNK
jgi:hypothetical protein